MNNSKNDIYDTIKEKNELKTLILKEVTKKLIKDYSKTAIKDYLYNIITRVYYYIINNSVYKEVNKQSIKILKEEIKILFYLNINIKKLDKTNEANFIIKFIELLECLCKINEIRIDYIIENTNIGRLQTSTYQLDNIYKLLDEKEKLKKELKLT